MRAPDDAASAGDNSLKQLIANLITASNTHDLDLATAFFALDYEGFDIAQRAPQQGRTGIRQAMARYFAAVPDLSIAVDDLVVASDRAVAVWTATGTHLGSLMNIPPSGRSLSVRGLATFALRNGQIYQATYIWDVAGLLRSIGLLPKL